MRLLLFFITIVFGLSMISCDTSYENWEGGAILRAGNFSYRDSLFIEVSVNNHIVTYKMLDGSGNTKLLSKHRFSDLHNWAIYLDEDKSLWIISNDIGHSIWKLDEKTKKFSYSEFDHYLTKDEVPPSLYKALRELID